MPLARDQNPVESETSDDFDRRLAAAVAVAGIALGTALIVHILSGVSLLFATIALVSGTAGCVVVAWRQADELRRRNLARRVRIGLAAGAVATVAYDLSRYVLVAVLSFSFQPFDVFRIFGELLVGTDAPPWSTYAAGWAFHIATGLGFAVAYVVIVARPRIWSAIVWAFVLEAAMILLYPSWLRMPALMEFVDVSIVGHLCYGLGLGLTAKRLMTPQDP